MDSGLEAPEFSVLFYIDLIWIEWATGKVPQGRLLRSDELVNFLNRTRFRHAGIGANLSPKHSDQDVAAVNQLPIDRFLWPQA